LRLVRSVGFLAAKGDHGRCGVRAVDTARSSGTPAWDRRSVKEGTKVAWTPNDIPDQHGRVAVVTGANGGLGLEVTRVLAGRGARVVMAARDAGKASNARRLVAADVPGADLEIRELDLASLGSVRACADGILDAYRHIDLLVNNAGVMALPEQATAQGFEMQLGVNHLGHFVLTRRLLPALLAAPAGRVVSITSFARLSGRPVDPDNPHLRGRYSPWRAYGQAKLANLQFAVELQRRLQATGARVQSLAAHPGLSSTDLQARSVRESGGWSQRFWHALARGIGMPPARGAQPLLRAATDPDARGGQLYGPRWGMFGPPVRRPVVGRSLGHAATRVLWAVSERETGERFDVAAIVGSAWIHRCPNSWPVGVPAEPV
jgi:NAD(P)-dependent dehydrogenase (short-subunit alcohol dehydrogenase family)